MKHTQEPWEIGFNGAGAPVITVEYRDICTIEESFGDAEANASRIVACVNACAGIENPGETIPALVAALEAALPLLPTFGPAGQSNVPTIEAVRAALSAAKENAQ